MKQSRDLPYERVIVSLPQALVGQLRQFAKAFRGGNKSGFIADAVRAHIDTLRRRRHTAKMRASYAAAATDGAKINKDWEALDDEAWARLDSLERRGSKAKR